MEKNKTVFGLFLASLLLSIIGSVYFSLLLFISLAPLLAILHIEHKARYKSFDFIALFLLVGASISSAILLDLNLLDALVYGILMWISTFVYLFTNKHSRNNLGLLTWIIYWLALEYVALKLNPALSYHLLGAAVSDPDLIPWSNYSGLTGISAWLLAGNVLLYISLFKDGGILNGQVRWLSISYSIILIALPIIISSFISLSPEIITPEITQQLYAEKPVNLTPYNANGEIFGRSAAWVSVLIIIYAFVKRETK